MAVFGGWRAFGYTASSPASGSNGGATDTSSTGSLGNTSGVCVDINGGKTLVHNMQTLGSNPSLSSLTANLKQLNVKISAAQSSAPADLKASFSAVDTADNALQKSIGQLRNSGMASSSYVQPLKSGVATLATAYDALVSLSKCS
jgi:hypothetical protein